MTTDLSGNLLTRAAEAYRQVDADPTKHEATAAALVTEARQAGDVEALVVALRAQAWAARARLDDTRAKQVLDEGARLARAHRLYERLGEVLVTRAAVNAELGRLTAAQRDLDAASGLVGGDALVQRELLQAALHQNIGRLSPAARIYRDLLSRPGIPLVIRGKVANNLGLIEAQRGFTAAAFRRLDEAAAAAVQTGPVLEAGVIQSRGWVTVLAGRLPEGLRLFDEAAQIFRDAGLPLGELYTEYADALVDLRLVPEATAATTRAVEEFAANGVPLMGADAQFRAARLSFLAGDHAGSIHAAQQAAASFRAQRRPAWAARADLVSVEARWKIGEAGVSDLRIARRSASSLERAGHRASAVHAHLTAGRLAIDLDQTAAAQRSLASARHLAQRGSILVRLDGRVAAALAGRLDGDDKNVLRQCRAGLSDLNGHRAALPSMELRALASGHGVELGQLGLAVSLRTGSALRVLDWMERTRSAALSAVAPPAQADLGDEMAELHDLHAELTRREAEPGARGSEGWQSALVVRQAEIESRVRRATWMRDAAVAVSAAPMSPPELRASLDGRILVEYGELDSALFAVVLEHRRSRCIALGASTRVADEARALAFSLRGLTHHQHPGALAAARNGAAVGLAQLAGMLLTPLDLPRDASLVVVPVAGLHGLPWAALHSGPVAVAPSASTFARTMQARTPPPATTKGHIVIVAGPDLPGAVTEAKALQQFYDRAMVLLPPQSTVAAVAHALDGASLAHLACHGDLRSDNPMFSSLRMSDGPLTLHELDSRGVAPRRILLASCEAGGHVSYAGDEILGFVSALMARGTTGLIASSVAVADVESVELMAAVHEALGSGATMSGALHQARAVVGADSPGAFATWCAFNAFGGA